MHTDAETYKHTHTHTLAFRCVCSDGDNPMMFHITAPNLEEKKAGGMWVQCTGSCYLYVFDCLEMKALGISSVQMGHRLKHE